MTHFFCAVNLHFVNNFGTFNKSVWAFTTATEFLWAILQQYLCFWTMVKFFSRYLPQWMWLVCKCLYVSCDYRDVAFVCWVDSAEMCPFVLTVLKWLWKLISLMTQQNLNQVLLKVTRNLNINRIKKIWNTKNDTEMRQALQKLVYY